MGRDAELRRSLGVEFDTSTPAQGLAPCATLTLPWFVSSWRWHVKMHFPCQPEAFSKRSPWLIPGTAPSRSNRKL